MARFVWIASSFVFLLSIGLACALTDVDENGYLEIHNCTELQQMNESLSSNYELMNNINCSGFDPNQNGSGFIPIGNLTDPFLGVLDGNTHTIYNFYINRISGNAALFSNTGTVGLRDINFVNMSITANEGYAGIIGVAEGVTADYVVAEGRVVSHIYGAGGFVAKSTGTVTITYSSMSGFVYGENNPTGGLVGEGSGTYDHVTNNANVTLASADYCGGIVGKAEGTTLINFGTNNGNISITSVFNNGAGGIIGTGDDVTIWSALNIGMISGSFNSGGLYGGQQDCGDCSLSIGWSHNAGRINVNGISVGGLAGWSGSVVIESSYNSGDMICGGVESISVGGLVGDPGSASITNSYNSGDINCPSATLVGGLVANPVGGGISITNSFNAGKIYAINAGALVGKINNSAVTIANSYWMNWSDVPIDCYFNLSDVAQNPAECGVISSDVDKYYFTANLVNEPMAQFGSFSVTACSYPMEVWESDDGLCRPDIHTYYNNSHGMIDWGLTPYIVNTDYVNVSNNYAFLNSTLFPQLNISANITLLNLFTDRSVVQILKDGVLCGDCYNFTTFNTGNVTFNVSSWSNYSIDFSPYVYLFSVSNSTSSSRDIVYNVSDDSNIYNCSIFVDGVYSSGSSVINSSINNTFTVSGLSVGTHEAYISCVDSNNNTGNSSGVAFIVSAEVVVESSGGSGSVIFRVPFSSLQDGFLRSMSRGDGLKFNISNETHSLILNSINSSYINISIHSVVQNFIIKMNESVLVDVDQDNKKDINVSYVKYFSGLASLRIMAIENKILTNNGNQTNETANVGFDVSKEMEGSSVSYWFLLLLLPVIFVIFILLKNKYKRR